MPTFMARMLWLASIAACAAPSAQASWLFDQVSPAGEGGGWTNRVVEDAAGTPIFFRPGGDGKHHLYELLDNGQRREFTNPHGMNVADLAASAGGLQVGMSRMSYDPLDEWRTDLEFLERSPQGQWTTDVVDTDLGANVGSTAVAFDPQGNPWIAYGRYPAGTLEVTTRDAMGQWRSSTLDTGIQWGYWGESFDLAFDPTGRPHVVFSDHAPAQHYWLEGDQWRKEPLPQYGANSVGHGLSFDRQGRAYMASISGESNSVLQLYRRDAAGWEPVAGSAVSALGGLADPALALDAADRPHLAAVAWDFGRFLVWHRWWNGAAWRQETVAGWSSNTSGPQAASLMIDDDNVIRLPFNTPKNSDQIGGDLYEARALGTPLGTPILIPASYDLRAEGTPGGAWAFADGDRQVLIRPNGDGTETRMLLSFDLSSVPAGVQIVGAELDLQQNGNPGINLQNTRAVLGYAFGDDGAADASDVESGPGHFQAGFLGTATASRFDENSFAVMRLAPGVIASVVASGATDLGMFLQAGDGQYPDPIRTMEDSQWLGSPWTAPRLWVYVRVPGDFDFDGHVDAADLEVWKSATGVDGRADADGDGDSDGADLLIWQRQLGSDLNSLLALRAASTTVPEPTGVLLALMAFLLMRRRSR